MGQSRPLFVYFRYFLETISLIQKRRWSAWESNPGPQDGRRRQNHRAMAANVRDFETVVRLLSRERSLVEGEEGSAQ